MASPLSYRLSTLAPPTTSRPWLPVLLGFLAMYLPLYYTLATMLWEHGTGEHQPIVLAISLYLFWKSRNALFRPNCHKTQRVLGWGVFILGLGLYVLGESQTVFVLSTGSQIPVLAGILLLTQGRSAIRNFWFPLLFLAFMIPLPGFLVDAATMPLKQHVSSLATQILCGLHYPAAHSGVVITIGLYQLLVANACSGMHSIFSLSAIGVFYLYLKRHVGWFRNVILIGALLPLAFISNVVRVVVLALITYYLGDAAGQGFLHRFAGLVLFAVAVLLLALVDSVIGFFLSRPSPPLPPRAISVANRSSPPRSPLLIAGGCMILATILAFALVPRTAMAHEGPALNLAAMIPKDFGSWHVVESGPQIVNPETQAELDRLYSQVLSRTFVNTHGRTLMLSIAYGGRQSDLLKVHKPEICYPAQGFTVVHGPHVTSLALPYGILPIRRLVAERGARIEPITYWIKIGDAIAGNSLTWKLDQIEYGLTGVVPDGLIFRVSTISPDYSTAYQLEADFIRSLLAHLPAASRRRLIGSAKHP